VNAVAARAAGVVVCRAGPVVVPDGPGFIALLEGFRASGGTAPAEIVAGLLEEQRAGGAASLSQLVHRGGVFGFGWRARLWIPLFQLEADDLSPRAGAQRVRAALPPMASGWDVAAWFATPLPRLDGQRPADLLDTRPGEVLQAARAAAPAATFEPRRLPSAGRAAAPRWLTG
jgi:hypothetical protein